MFPRRRKTGMERMLGQVADVESGSPACAWPKRRRRRPPARRAGPGVMPWGCGKQTGELAHSVDVHQVRIFVPPTPGRTLKPPSTGQRGGFNGKYSSASAKGRVRPGGGTLQDMSAYVTDINGRGHRVAHRGIHALHAGVAGAPAGRHLQGGRHRDRRVLHADTATTGPGTSCSTRCRTGPGHLAATG